MITILNNIFFPQAALSLIESEGKSELARAQLKSSQFDSQSESMSDLSREARKNADELEKTAESYRASAKDTKERAINASDIAKNTIDLQRSITDQLKTKIAPDFPSEEKKLETLKKLTAESLEKANSVYDESLTLIAKVNGLPIPELNLQPIKEESARLSAETDEIKKNLDDILDSHEDLLSTVEGNINLSEILIAR